jgi:hypothetical protein
MPKKMNMMMTRGILISTAILLNDPIRKVHPVEDLFYMNHHPLIVSMGILPQRPLARLHRAQQVGMRSIIPTPRNLQSATRTLQPATINNIEN